MTNQTPDAKMVLLPSPTKAQLHSACLSFRHDYGVMDEDARASLRETALEWLRAWQREFPQPAPEPTWHPINPADPATLPGEDDADEEEYVWVRKKPSGKVGQDFWCEVGADNATHWAPRIKQVPPVWEDAIAGS